MSVVFSRIMHLIHREQIGTDEWGAPLATESMTPVFGSYYQYVAMEGDENGKVSFLPPRTMPEAWDAMMWLDPDGQETRWEVRGHPEPKYSLARPGGEVHHWEVLVRRAP